jgi:hypothetical protein
MPSLREIQRAVRAALLDGDEAAALALVADDRPDVRLDVHRTNVIASLTAALQETFPVVCRLVDERFFAFAAHEFICEVPPVSPIVADYGAGFADFLAEFPPCRELVYLADVARLEWLIDRAARAPEGAPPAYLSSAWPIDRIWRANQPDADDEPISLDAGGVRLEVRRNGPRVEIRSVP